jgi:hypothetical protein
MARRHSTKRTEGGRKRRRTMRGGTMVATPLPKGGQNIIGTLLVEPDNVSGPVPGGSRSATDDPKPNYTGNYAAYGGRRRRKTKKVVKKKSVKAIKRLLKAKGLKVSGSRRALTLRARKARIPMKGGRSALTGAPYRSYQGGEGNADAGLPSEFNLAHPVSNDVLTLPGYGLGSSEFITSGSGGLVPA